jgi:hypothetical protein
MDQAQPASFLWPDLLAEYVDKLSVAAAVGGNRHPAWFVDDDYFVVLIYYFNSRFSHLFSPHLEMPESHLHFLTVRRE